MRYTLLGYSVTTGGCENPDIDFSIIKEGSGHITFEVNITQKGSCRVMRIKNNWCLTPKIDPFPEFKVEVNLTKK